jgi:hypothetical protein
MSPKVITPIVLMPALVVIAISMSSCNRGNSNSDSTNNSPSSQSTPAATPKTGFEADLEYIRKGQYTYVWVISRKDGKPMDKNDSDYLQTNAPQLVDRVTSGEGKKVVAGTNFDLAKGNLALLQKRYNFEDYTAK